MGCRAEIRTRACLTESQRATNRATLHPICVQNHMVSQRIVLHGTLLTKTEFFYSGIYQARQHKQLSQTSNPLSLIYGQLPAQSDSLQTNIYTQNLTNEIHRFREIVTVKKGSKISRIFLFMFDHFVPSIRRLQVTFSYPTVVRKVPSSNNLYLERHPLTLLQFVLFVMFCPHYLVLVKYS